jgi:hypothetical protein
MTDYAIVLNRRFAGREWILNGDDYAGLVMLDGSNKPTKKTLDDLWPEVQAEIADEAEAKVAARASALAKLKVLGLTDDEIAALIGG